MKKLSKRDDWGRKLRSLIKHSVLMTAPASIAVGASVVWLPLQYWGLHFPDKGSLEIVATSVLVFIVPFALLCATAIEIAANKSAKIVDSLMPPNKDLFMRYRDERIRTMMHVGLAALAASTIIVIGLFPFPALWVGGLTVFLSTFTITIPWVIIRELEDPARSPWVMERIPSPDWLTDDVDEYFKLHIHHRPEETATDTLIAA